MIEARGGLPPGPRGLPVVGNGPAFLRDPIGFCRRAARAYGDVVYVAVPFVPFYLVNHPADIEAILVRDHQAFRKERYTRAIGEVTGNGLIVSEGSFWKRQRRLAQPAFHARRLDRYAAMMVEDGERAASRWRDGDIIDVHLEMMRLTLGIVGKALFTADVSNDADAVGAALDVTMRHFLGVGGTGFRFPKAVPTPGNRRHARAIAEIDRVVHRIIGERRADGRDRGDLLSMLLLGRDEQGEPMTEQQLRDELVTLFLAGHETTAVALTFIWYLLAMHPDSARALRRELVDVLGDRAATADDVRALPFTNAVVKEAMRLYPPVWGIGREPLCDYAVRGYRLPRGSQVFLTQAIVHRDPRFFDEPDAFRPERWTERFEAELPRFAYFPFGGGPRVCIGAGFATMEAVLLVATIARRFTLALAPGERLDLMPSVTLRPRRGLRMVARALHDADA